MRREKTRETLQVVVLTCAFNAKKIIEKDNGQLKKLNQCVPYYTLPIYIFNHRSP